MKGKIFALLAIFVFGGLIVAKAQDIVGQWKTIDDETNEVKSVVEIYKGKDGKYYGKIIKLFPKPGEDPNPKCTECSGDKYNKPIIGMVILTGLEKEGKNDWDDGEILDPESGNVYDCKMWIEDGNLHVRGYLGWSLIGRSQVWKPYKK